MAPETPVGLPLPDGGLLVSGRACWALKEALRAHVAVTRKQGHLVHPVVLKLTRLADDAAADHERRRVLVSAGSAVVARRVSAAPRSDWVDVRHAALALGVTERQVRNLCEHDVVLAVKNDQHHWRINPQSIEDYRVRREHGQGEHQGSDC